MVVIVVHTLCREVVVSFDPQNELQTREVSVKGMQFLRPSKAGKKCRAASYFLVSIFANKANNSNNIPIIMKLPIFLLCWMSAIAADGTGARTHKSLRGKPDIFNQGELIFKERSLIFDDDKPEDDFDDDFVSDDEGPNEDDDYVNDDSEDEYDDNASPDTNIEDIDYEDSVEEELNEEGKNSLSKNTSYQLSNDRDSAEDEDSDEDVYDVSSERMENQMSKDINSLGDLESSGDDNDKSSENIDSNDSERDESEEGTDESSVDPDNLATEDEDEYEVKESLVGDYEESSEDMGTKMSEIPENKSYDTSYDDSSENMLSSSDFGYAQAKASGDGSYSDSSEELSATRASDDDGSSSEDESIYFESNDSSVVVGVKYQTAMRKKETETFGSDIGVEEYISSTSKKAKSKNQSWIFVAVVFQMTMLFLVLRRKHGSKYHEV